MEESTDYVLQGILTLSTDNLKDTFFHLGGDIRDLPELKKCMYGVDITQRRIKPIIEEVSMTVMNMRYEVRGLVTEYLRGRQRT